MLQRGLRVLLAVAGGVMLVGLVLFIPRGRISAVVAPTAESPQFASAAAGDAFVFRFNPLSQTFQVFTIPTTSAAPDGIALRERPGAVEVWFAEAGADQIGRLIYTDTTSHSLREYGLAAGSRPLNIAVDANGAAWFTESGRNRIGRIESGTGVSSEFPVSTANVVPMGIAVAPDGSIWFTEHATDQIGQLVVTPTSDFSVREYFVGLTNSQLSGIAVQNDDSIWSAMSNLNKLARLQPSIPRIDRTPPLVPTPGYPYQVAIAPDNMRIWFTELEGNHISLSVGTTQESSQRYTVPTADSRPYDLDVDSTGAVWFSEQTGGKIGRLVVTTTATFSEFPLPLPRARVHGIAVDSTGAVWFVADVWHVTYLPVIHR